MGTCFGCSEYDFLKAARAQERAMFRDSERLRRPHDRIIYPIHLQGPFIKFIAWLREQVRRLRLEDFPTPQEVVNFSIPPDPVTYSYHSMWAYAAHYRCDAEEGPSHAIYDTGIS